MQTESVDIRENILRTFHLHPEIESVVEIESDDSLLELEVVYSVNLPSRRASRDGFKCRTLQEKVFFTFPQTYPFDPPELALRRDFDQNVPHLQPWLDKMGRPVPCVSVQSLTEFIFSRGLAGVIDQVAAWLNNHASGTLIDDEQGWEPARRDSVRHGCLCDLEEVHGFLTRHESGCYLGTQFMYFKNHDDFFFIAVDKKVSTPNAQHGDIRKQLSFDQQSYYGIGGRSLLLLAWPGEDQECSEYRPDLVRNLRDLIEFAEYAGTNQVLLNQIEHIRTCLKRLDGPYPPILTVGLCVRRPFNLIGKNSNIEVFFYLVGSLEQSLSGPYESVPVEPLAHYDSLSAALLQRLSFDVTEAPERRSRWSLLGCGSLGSKVALHLARTGHAPVIVADQSSLRPHNAARHGLAPQRGGSLAWIGPKAVALAESLGGLGKKPESYTGDVVQPLLNRQRIQEIVPRASNFVVNATASLRVREALGKASGVHCPVIEVGVFGRGATGYLFCEGAHRRPNCQDLTAELNWQRFKLIEGGVLPFNEGGLSDLDIGQGCSSATMVMPDHRISLFGATFAEMISRWQAAGLPESGRLSFGRFEEDGLNLNWLHWDIPAPSILEIDGWSIRISSRAILEMNAEVAQWANVETGGVVLGNINVHLKTINVSAVLEAPPDSRRTASLFQLGIGTLKQQLDRVVRLSHRSVYCLGTWHSHLHPSPPSATDHSTAEKFRGHRPSPFLFLIHLPDGRFDGIVSE